MQLTTDIGSTASSFSDLFGSGSASGNSRPLTLPIFNAGRSSASLSLAETRKHIAVAQYEGSIQTAFREVADALSARDALRQQIEAQRKVRDADRERQRLAERRHARGVTNYLEMLRAAQPVRVGAGVHPPAAAPAGQCSDAVQGAGRLGTGFGRELSRVRARRVRASVPDPPRSRSARLRKRHQSAALTR